MAETARRVHRRTDREGKSQYKCVSCEQPMTQVRDSRPTANGLVRRRRYCQNCTTSFSTVEIPIEIFEALDVNAQLYVVAEAFNNTVEQFNKLRRQIRAVNKATTIPPDKKR